MNFYERAYKEPEEFIISNDAYHYLLDGETCLDDDNKKEADSLIHRIGLNYSISKIQDELDGRVKVCIIPFDLVESKYKYTKYIELFNNWQLEIAFINAKNVFVRYHNTKTGYTYGHQHCEIQYLDKGHTQIKTVNGSIYPLWNSQSNEVKNFVG